MKIISNLTIGILTCDQSSTYNKTVEGIKKQLYSANEIIEIRNICPYLKAIIDLVEKTKTEFLIISDDDIVFLANDATKKMVDDISNTNLDEIVYSLNDPIFGKILGIRIYRTKEVKKIIDKIKANQDFMFDMIHKELEKENKTMISDVVIGSHHEKWNDIDLYWKMFNVAKKLNTRDLKNKTSLLENHINTLCNIKENKKLILFGFCGLIDGLKSETEKVFLLTYKNKFDNSSFKKLEESL